MRESWHSHPKGIQPADVQSIYAAVTEPSDIESREGRGGGMSNGLGPLAKI